ncbi:MAG TPA: type I-B CRISPR-associated protein Cas5b [Candidatus Cloacimonadota bacterium]|jgi:CRISPR-associated protein Cas5h|nr:type I-B CRISPR-associated protein Cas5b [Candidatus Cloacimonadota bacterium]HOG30701.1 type I-B CRISPR-associated protein Cas5b [Candidatus Cloacimonadota bacterium]HPB09509.1 type I-B CRISPR-associated protein Cas5b [Candidatus Cloacimonadota bacterium]HPL23019.1 type I-B CRISPR-associated protein Cas5b [Candidatus Cloacimonadota bacterium]HQO44769.1 type I-B CRISPR-associated protein Cas5b [Candidatus Cloacimonadota bacterium]
MTPGKVICFELFGDYAQYKKFFANMSPLSFSIPPRTALSGTIGAILGIDKSENPERFNPQDSFIALRLMNEVKKTKIAHNYLKTTSLKHVSRFQEHKPTNVEFLKDVRYRIYFACEDAKMYQKLKELLEAHKSVYTISLGISGCLANFEYLGEFGLTPLEPGHELLVDSVVPMASIDKVLLNTPARLQKAVMPVTMGNDRVVDKYEEVLYELEGNPMNLVLKDIAYKVNDLQDVIHGF